MAQIGTFATTRSPRSPTASAMAHALPADFDRPSVLAKEALEVRLVRKRPPESPLVPEPFRQRARLVQNLATRRELAERQEGAPLLEPQVDELLGPLPALGQLPQCAPAPDRSARAPRRAEPVERPGPRLPAIPRRPCPTAARAARGARAAPRARSSRPCRAARSRSTIRACRRGADPAAGSRRPPRGSARA